MSPIRQQDPFGGIKTPSKGTNAPDPSAVNQFHSKSDVDSADNAQHHTLGIKTNQASPGDHKHDGRSSKKILENVNIVDTAKTTYNQADFQTIIDALKQLGAS